MKHKPMAYRWWVLMLLALFGAGIGWWHTHIHPIHYVIIAGLSFQAGVIMAFYGIKENKED